MEHWNPPPYYGTSVFQLQNGTKIILKNEGCHCFDMCNALRPLTPFGFPSTVRMMVDDYGNKTTGLGSCYSGFPIFFDTLRACDLLQQLTTLLCCPVTLAWHPSRRPIIRLGRHGTASKRCNLQPDRESLMATARVAFRHGRVDTKIRQVRHSVLFLIRKPEGNGKR